MANVIELKNVSKSFKEKEALKDISVTISEGECVALLGKNGAGKSTLLNLILNLFYPSSGEIKLSYHKKEVGFLSQETRFPDDVTIQEMLDFVGSFSENPLSDSEIDQVLGFEKEKYKQLIYTCSGGEKRLFDTCLAILNRPKLLIVDEPTSGMDTSTRNHFWQLMKQLKAQGTTIFFTTHYVEEVDYCADRVVLLDNGKVKADETPYHLRTLNQKKIVAIEKDCYQLFEKQLLKLVQTFKIEVTEKTDVFVWTFKNELANQLMEELLAIHVPLDNIEMTNTSLLDTIFSNQTTEERGE